jgi:hypothetical protein
LHRIGVGDLERNAFAFLIDAQNNELSGLAARRDFRRDDFKTLDAGGEGLLRILCMADPESLLAYPLW